MLKKISLSFGDFKKLYKYCKSQKILFISTPFDNESAIFLNKLGQKIFKISLSKRGKNFLCNGI